MGVTWMSTPRKECWLSRLPLVRKRGPSIRAASSTRVLEEAGSTLHLARLRQARVWESDLPTVAGCSADRGPAGDTAGLKVGLSFGFIIKGENFVLWNAYGELTWVHKDPSSGSSGRPRTGALDRAGRVGSPGIAA